MNFRVSTILQPTFAEPLWAHRLPPSADSTSPCHPNARRTCRHRGRRSTRPASPLRRRTPSSRPDALVKQRNPWEFHGIEWGLNRISWGFHEIELDSTELNMIYINEMYILYHGDFMGIFEPPEERKEQSNLKIVDIVFYRFGDSANEDLNNASQLGEYPI